MKVNRIDNLIFKGRIIDSHAHVGGLAGKNYTKSNLDIFVKSTLPNNDSIEKIIVSTLDVLTSLKDEYFGNKELLDIFKDDNHYQILASCSPRTGNLENIQKLFGEFPNKFAGLKFHPTIDNLELTDNRYEPYLKFATEQKLPCLFHTAVTVDSNGHSIASNQDVSNPEMVYSLARKFPMVPVVLAHMGAGGGESHDRTIKVLLDSIKRGNANLYADISWVDIGQEHFGNYAFGEHRTKEHVINAIKALKGIGDTNWVHGDQSYRLMFGTDAPIDRFSNDDAIDEYVVFVDDIKKAIREDKDLNSDAENIINNLFYENAKNLYGNRTCAPTFNGFKCKNTANKKKAASLRQ